MSITTIASLQRITPQELASTLRQPEATRPKLSIVDVRDSDYIGGHIVGCANVPTALHDTAMPELARKLADRDLVVFHCALSQQRGPASALRYLRERERLLPSGGASQRVVVLEGGFVKWQELYGEDADLTEGYVKDIWEHGGY